MIVNCWYVGCPSSQLPAKRPVGTQIGDHNIVLFRDEANQPHALLDRCCHRGLPLSRGIVTDGRLQCGYHGWQYDGAGKCVRIPSQREDRPVPERYGVTAFACEEKDSYVWIWVGEERPSALTAIPEAAKGWWAQGARTIRCNYVRALENLFDMCHVPFVHPTHVGTVRSRKAGLVLTSYELRETDSSCVVFTPPVADEREPIGNPTFRMEFTLPNVIRHAVPAGDDYFYMIFFVTPLGLDSCRMDWLMTKPTPPAGGERVEWQGQGGAIGDEDQAVLESLQLTYAEEGEEFECSVEGDLPTLTLRRIVMGAEVGDRAPGASTTTVRRRLLSLMTVPRQPLR